MSGSGPYRGARVEKPWGYELIWAQTDRYAGKILHIEAGHSLSLQYHRAKDETLYLLSGSLVLEVGDSDVQQEVIEMHVGESIHLPPGRRHRLHATTCCDVLEASTPELDDVVRLVDRYGREGGKPS